MINSSIWYVGSPVSNYSLNGYTVRPRPEESSADDLCWRQRWHAARVQSNRRLEEKIAYVPRGVIPNLAKLTYTTYNDNLKYFVDGSPVVVT